MLSLQRIARFVHQKYILVNIRKIMSSVKVWSQFESIRKSDGAVYKFRVREATANDKDVFLEFMEKYMITTESFNKAAGTAKRKESKNEMVELYRDIYTHAQIMIVQEDNEFDREKSIDNPIVAVNLMVLDKVKDNVHLPEKIEEAQTPEVKKLLSIIHTCETFHNEREMLGLDKYYAGIGVCVRPDFAGLGIAKELLRLRRELCKEHGVPATGAWMTAIGSQKAAERDGWKTVFEIPFDELGQLCDCEFVNTPPMCKLMVAYV